MNRTDAPAKQAKPFGINGQREAILPTTPAGDNTASYDQGFPPITMILKSAGGLPPKGQDMNQILYELSSLARWSSAGALNTYDSTFATSISGYPSGAALISDDGLTIYINTTDGNTTNPNTGGSGWETMFDYLNLIEGGNTDGKLALIGNVKTQNDKCAVIVKSGSNANGKYRVWSDGSIDMWGNGIANTSGDALVNYPISLPAAAQNITTTPLVLSTGTSRPTTSVMVVTDLTTATKATFFVKRADGTTSADGFYWSANYASF
ncbi:TPA: hypothetical protein ACIFST_000054 [Citrobacter farmeri]